MVRPLSRPRSCVPLPRNENPLVIAHRGASYAVAEHTLPAYLAAIETGADGLECDVRLTRDGHLVCVHDRTVNRTSNGTGIVSELDLSGLRQLDFLSWHDQQPRTADEVLADSSYLSGVAPDRMGPDQSTVLTLETLLSVVADAGRPLKLLIETKHPTRYGGLVEKELVRLLKRFGWAGNVDGGPVQHADDESHAAAHPVTIMSFAPVALRRIRLLAPSIPLTLLLRRWASVRRDGSLPTGVSIGGPSVHLLRSDPDYVELAHAAGSQVYCWTIDKPADVELVRSLGVDGIITNRPAMVAGELRATPPERRTG